MEKVGLLAGIGNLPVEFMRAAKQSGHEVVVIAVVEDVAPELAAEADVYYEINVAKLNKIQLQPEIRHLGRRDQGDHDRQGDQRNSL